MSLVGKLLVATPGMPDENFRKSVVLVVKDNDEGAMGVVVNRPTSDPIKDVWSSLKESGKEAVTCEIEDPIYHGGPVWGPICAIHKNEQSSEENLTNGLFWSSDGENLNSVISGNKLFRIFTGYAGWGKGQLLHEIQCGGWMILDAVDDIVFGKEPDQYHQPDIWRQAFRKCGEKQLQSLGIKNIPENPQMN